MSVQQNKGCSKQREQNSTDRQGCPICTSPQAVPVAGPLMSLGVSSAPASSASLCHIYCPVAQTHQDSSGKAGPGGMSWQHHGPSFSKDLARDAVTASWSAKSIPPFRRRSTHSAKVGVWEGPKELRKGVGIIGNPDVFPNMESWREQALFRVGSTSPTHVSRDELSQVGVLAAACISGVLQRAGGGVTGAGSSRIWSPPASFPRMQGQDRADLCGSR